ncbi:MAG TPA: peptidoglycan bridge formation glycyltransferase FemA/FemB family protein [Candidatus Bathyarchaeia archaeon]|nr:peptidoglycan bridge formation glycyltransferase FemA/FemB family protein [Candidatus Bathyarchaeia archaeon]
MNNEYNNFIESNSPDGGFLQSEHWRKFQESVGRKTFMLSADIAFVSIVTHTLPIVGDYFYMPRGPVVEAKSEKRKTKNYNEKFKTFFSDLLNIARKNNAGWVRIEPASDGVLEFLRFNLKNIKIKKSAVDMQPREVLILDISESEENLLAETKQKTRYNIRLAEKKGVKISASREEKYIDEFLRLVKITSERDKITPHPENYYRRMFEAIPSDILKLYIAEYEGKVIAANLVLFFGKTATYMHGASDNAHRSVMAPYLLQWQQIQDAKKWGCRQYDLGGVRIQPHPDPLLIEERGNSWVGITKFKTGFAPNTKPTKFPGSYDIILKPAKYNLYRVLQKIKRIF